MAHEIERKFLVTGDGWNTQVSKHVDYRQGYLASDKSCSIRIRVSDTRAHLNIKSATLGVERLEYEYEIPLGDAHEMLDRLSCGPLVEKTRYYVPQGGHTWEIDVFKGDNAGLIVAEIELARADEPFERPAWLGEEVSEDPRYYNVCLARNPFKNWKKE